MKCVQKFYLKLYSLILKHVCIFFIFFYHYFKKYVYLFFIVFLNIHALKEDETCSKTLSKIIFPHPETCLYFEYEIFKKLLNKINMQDKDITFLIYAIEIVSSIQNFNYKDIMIKLNISYEINLPDMSSLPLKLFLVLIIVWSQFLWAALTLDGKKFVVVLQWVFIETIQLYFFI